LVGESDPGNNKEYCSARKDSYEKVETKAVEDRDGIRHKVVRESTGNTISRIENYRL